MSLAFSQAYEHRAYDPPMPVLDIGVSRPGVNVPSATVEAVVDTGADGSLLPLDVLEQAGAIFVDRAYMRGITGQRQAVDLYLITIHLGRFRITRRTRSCGSSWKYRHPWPRCAQPSGYDAPQARLE